MPGLHWLGPWMMEGVVGMRNRRFDRGKRVTNVGVPVISVGNITVGGTGKTPMVQWIIRHLLEIGRHPAIALRGYKSKGGISDEAQEHRAALPDVPVLVGPRRVDTIRHAIAQGTAMDCVVLDDGFQHRFVHRDLDIVLVDARRAPDQDAMLPKGRLREPARNLRRADAVVITHADHADADLGDRIQQLHGDVPVSRCTHVWDGLDRHGPDGTSAEPLDALRGLRVVTRFAIAGPDALRQALMSHGATIVQHLPAKDHAHPTPRVRSQLADAAQSADAIVVSRKDWVVLAPLLATDPLACDVLVPRLALHFTQGEAALRARIDACVGASHV